MSKLNLRPKLILAILLLGLIPYISISVITLINSEQSLKHAVEYELTAVRDIKTANLQQYFDTIGSQIKLVARNKATIEAYKAFDESFQEYPIQSSSNFSSNDIKKYWVDEFAKKYASENGIDFKTDQFFAKLSNRAIQFQHEFIAANPQPLGEKNGFDSLNNGTAYSRTHETYHPWFNDYLSEFGYYDIFIVNQQSEVIYSVFKELDFATSLKEGPWANTGIAEAYQKGLLLNQGEVYFTDLALYSPSYDAPAGFVSSPIFEGEKLLGVLIFQMPLDRISTIMSQRSGLGETGESYLIGSDKLMRSDSYLDPEGHSVINSFRSPEKGMVDTQAAEAVLDGKTGVEVIKDYNNNDVISAYMPIFLGEHKWGLLVEIDVDEAFAPIVQLEFLVLIIGLIGAALIGVVGYLVAQSIAKPILALSEQMEMIGRNFDFSKTIEVKSNDEIGKAGASLNNLLSKTKVALDEVNFVIDKMANGDLTHRIKAELSGDLAKLKRSVNTSAENVDNVLNEMNSGVLALSEGRFDVTVDVVGNGIYSDMLTQMNSSFHALSSIIESINIAMSSMNEGDFSGTVAVEAQGSLDLLKSNINGSLHNMASVIEQISHVMEAQAAGDLTVTLPSGKFKGQLHDLKNAINYSSMKVKEVVNVAIDSSNVVSGAAQEVSDGAHDLSARVQEQASALEETSATMEQMNSQVQSNSESATGAAVLANQVKVQAHDGIEVMDKTIEAMVQIQDSSERIAEIVGLIDGIAFQTNLLALNAAVEAARAGEHGRGFAVVAGEVRNLAQKSAEAAKDIKGLVDETVQRVSHGSMLAQSSGTALKEMNDSVEEVGNMIAQIAQASKEQSEGVQQVHDAITQIDDVTQQNASLVEETTAAAESLSNQSEILRKEMMFFNTGSEHRVLEQQVSSSTIEKVIEPNPLNDKTTTQAIHKIETHKAEIKKDDSDQWSEF